jgi:hypothetical protein
VSAHRAKKAKAADYILLELKKKKKCNNQKGAKQQVASLCAEYTLTLARTVAVDMPRV